MNKVSKLLLCLMCSVCFISVGFTAQRVVVCEIIAELG
jgi:hypothetical protein